MNVYDDTDYEFVGDDDYWSLGRISLDYNMKWFFFYVFGFISYFYERVTDYIAEDWYYSITNDGDDDLTYVC